MQQICVYCASSTQVDSVYFDAASQLGRIFAEARIRLIYGAGEKGLMGYLADSILASGGEITGVIPRFMCENNWHHPLLTELIITESMHERKQKMALMADAVVALPGGCGTLEELLEIITWKQLGLFTKPIIIVNVAHYYDPLLAMLHKAIDEKFMGERHRAIWQVVDEADDVLSAIQHAPSWDESAMLYSAL